MVAGATQPHSISEYAALPADAIPIIVPLHIMNIQQNAINTAFFILIPLCPLIAYSVVLA
jgi:hypothetical protein